MLYVIQFVALTENIKGFSMCGIDLYRSHCFTLDSLSGWVLSFSSSSSPSFSERAIFWVFGMTQPGIESLSPGPLANTLLT